MSEPPQQQQGYVAAAPASVPGMIPPAPSVWPTVIGTISIVLGVMGLLCYGCSSIGAMLGPLLANVVPPEVLGPQPQGVFLVYWIASHCAALLLSLWLLVAGIGIAQRRAWARSASLGWATTKMAVTVADTVLGFVFISDIATHFSERWSRGQPQTAQLPEGVMELVMAFVIIVGFFFTLIWPVFLLIWFARRRVRAEIAHWRQQEEFGHMM